MFDIAVLLNVSRAGSTQKHVKTLSTIGQEESCRPIQPISLPGITFLTLKNKYCMADLKVPHEEF